MKITLSIAKYTFLEAFRDKFIWLVLAIMLLGIPAGLFIRSVTLFGAETSFPATVLAVLSISLIAVSVLYVNIATRRELDGKIMLVILSRPTPNSLYLIGKLLGFWFIASLYVVVAGLIVLALGISSIQTTLVYMFGLWLVQLMIIAWSLFFALLLNSVAASVLVSLMIWFLCTSVQALWHMSWVASAGVMAKITGSIFYYILPNYSRFDFKHAVLYNDTVPFADYAILPVYAAAYTVIILILAWIDFSRKEY